MNRNVPPADRPTLPLAKPGLIVDVLLKAAETRTRAAKAASDDVERDALAGLDVRSSSVRITRILAEAGALERTADALLSGQLILASPPPAAAPAPKAKREPTKRARAVAERRAKHPLAGAKVVEDDRIPPNVAVIVGEPTAEPVMLTDELFAEDDPLTGALPEDNPSAAEIAAALPPKAS
jgi:hypothetical protein